MWQGFAPLKNALGHQNTLWSLGTEAQPEDDKVKIGGICLDFDFDNEDKNLTKL